LFRSWVETDVAIGCGTNIVMNNFNPAQFGIIKKVYVIPVAESKHIKPAGLKVIERIQFQNIPGIFLIFNFFTGRQR